MGYPYFIMLSDKFSRALHRHYCCYCYNSLFFLCPPEVKNSHLYPSLTLLGQLKSITCPIIFSESYSFVFVTEHGIYAEPSAWRVALRVSFKVIMQLQEQSHQMEKVQFPWVLDFSLLIASRVGIIKIAHGNPSGSCRAGDR